MLFMIYNALRKGGIIMKKYLSPKILTAIVVISVFTVIAAGIAGTYFFIEHLSEGMESGEEHITKTLPPASDKEMWVFGARDFTVYGKYYYENGIDKEILDNHELLKKVTEDDIMPLRKVVWNYEEWVESTKGNGGLFGDDISKVYDFDTWFLREKECYYYFEARKISDIDSVDDQPYKASELEDIDYFYSYNLYIYCDNILYIMHNDT